MIETAVIVANWNGKKYLKDCFDSLAKQTYQNFRIIFVDNGSKDDSVGFIEKNYPETEIIRLEENTGFCFGYNTGIKKALEDENIKYIVVLNNDTKLHEKFIEDMVDCSQRHPEAGSIQPKILNFYEQNKIDCAGILLSVDGVVMNRGYGEENHGQYEKEEELFGANATAALYSREALEKTQLRDGEYFDESYFAYYEDADLAWRMRLAGFKSYFCPSAKLFHIHSATAKKISGLKAYYLNRNRFFTLIKNYPCCRLVLILFILTPIRYLLLLIRVIMKRSRKGEELAGQNKFMVAKEIFRAWGSVITNIPNLMRKRRAIQKNKKVKKSEIRRWFRDYGVKWLKTF